jgi:hypothetical protein
MRSPRKEGQAAQYLSFTSIYDVCKSAKGVRSNGDFKLAVFTGRRFRDENKTKGPRKSRGPLRYEISDPIVTSAPPVEAPDQR